MNKIKSIVLNVEQIKIFIDYYNNMPAFGDKNYYGFNFINKNLEIGENNKGHTPIKEWQEIPIFRNSYNNQLLFTKGEKIMAFFSKDTQLIYLKILKIFAIEYISIIYMQEE